MSQNATATSRRNFIAKTSTIAASGLLPRALSGQAAGVASVPLPLPTISNRDTSLKFNPDGTPRAFLGNTVICHMPAQCLMRDAMVELRNALEASRFRPKLGITPVDSYHMTIFSGANDQDRVAEGWPSFVDMDAPIDVCNRVIGERMAKARIGCELPLRVRLEVQDTLTYRTACTMRVVPIDAEEEKKIRSVRDQLSEIYGFRQKNHDSYQFHITMSYQLVPFTDTEQAAYRTLLASHVSRIVQSQAVLELGNPEFCTFANMFRFEPKKLIHCA